MSRMSELHEERSARTSLRVCLLLIAGVLVVYAQVYDFDFVNYDDPDYVYANLHVTSGLTLDGLRWAFTSGFESNWLPLTRLSHMLDCQLFGLHAGAHHLISVWVHLVNALLLFGVLQAMTGAVWQSAWIAGMFAVHPLHVESVAWISERKDLLSTLFGLLSLWLYVRYAQQPGWRRYALALLAFACSLMAKQMLVTLPLLFLLLDVWPLGRVSWPAGPRSARPRSRHSAVLIEKIPFTLLAAAAGCVTFMVQRAGGSVVSTTVRPITARFANALLSYVGYMAKLACPTGLTFFYPYHAWAPGQVAAAAALLGGLSVGALWIGRRRHYVLVGWLWYLVTLLPVIGIVQVGDQAMADRYTYLPAVGLFIIVAWGVPELLSGWRSRRVAVTSAAVCTLAIYMIAAQQQAATWRNSQALFAHALAVTPDNHIAHNNLGFELAKQGHLDAAIAHYITALQDAPGDVKAHYNLGNALLQKGNASAAIEQFVIAAQLKPDYPLAQQALGDALVRIGRFTEALPHYREAFDRGLQSPSMLNNFAVALANGGDLEGALRQYEAALTIDPNYSEAHFNAARVLTQLDRRGAAVEHLEAAVRLLPDDAEAHLRLGELLAQLGRRNEGVVHAQRALQLHPGWSEAEALVTRLVDDQHAP